MSSSDDEGNAIVLVLTTIGVAPEAESIATTLVEERLAACVNVLHPMASTYRWKGRVERELEQQLVIKTSASLVPALERRLKELHPYELPEFLVLRAASASAAYLAWVEESVGPAAPR
jgi:periplasmic divalent cation tolerance protein